MYVCVCVCEYLRAWLQTKKWLILNRISSFFIATFEPLNSVQTNEF